MFVNLKQCPIHLASCGLEERSVSRQMGIYFYKYCIPKTNDYIWLIYQYLCFSLRFSCPPVQQEVKIVRMRENLVTMFVSVDKSSLEIHVCISKITC